MNGEEIKAVQGTDEKGNPIVELVDGEGGILLRLPMMNEGGAPLAKRSDERGAGKRFGGRFLRAKVMMLATALALTVGLSSMALAANGKPFLLGKNNAATAISTLTKQGPGPALRLLVRPGQPPLAVNSTVKVANLNADKVDGLDSSAFLPAGGTAADSELLDGNDSSDFQASNAAAGGDLTGNYPDPQIATDAVGSDEIARGAVSSDEIANGAVGTRQSNSTQVQQRVSDSCPPDSSIRSVAQDGTVACEADGVTGREIVEVSTSFNNGRQKAVTAFCPEGKIAISGGGEHSILEDEIFTFGSAIALQGSIPGSGRSWRTEAAWVEEGTPPEWRLIAYAVCVNQ